MPRSEHRRIECASAGPQSPRFVHLLAFEDQATAPRTLRLDVHADDRDNVRALVPGVWWDEGPFDQQWLLPIACCLQIVTGTRDGIARSIYADVRPGDYNLSACDAVRVSVAYWQPYGIEGSVSPIDVSAAVVDGPAAESTPLKFTAMRALDATEAAADPITASSVSCPLPPGAYAYDLSAGSHGIIAQGYGHASIGSPEVGPAVARHPTGRWVPPSHPIPLDGVRRIAVKSSTAGIGERWRPQLSFYVR